MQVRQKKDNEMRLDHHAFLLVVLLASSGSQSDAFALSNDSAKCGLMGYGRPQSLVSRTIFAQNVPYYRDRNDVILAAAKNSKDDEMDENKIIDAIIEEEIAAVDAAAESTSVESSDLTLTPAEQTRRRKRDVIRNVLRRLADLSLRDYQWRSSLFKANEADRQVEESLARMMGEDAAYLRPMDASDEKRGPLGRAEKKVVSWLSSVIEEEGKRAKRIANSEGDLVRPMDLEDVGEGGPLSRLERRVVNFLDRIRQSEQERATNKILRPKDMEEGKRGPLGEAEARAVSTISEIATSEKMRAQLSKQRGGEVVRPIDVPGPLGEVERKVLEAMSAERQRAKERELNDGKCVRPKDATIPGPLGEAERKAMEDLTLLSQEERERLRNIQRVLQEKRPLESDPESALGLTERFAVGLLNGPRLLGKVAERVVELMSSSKLDDGDAKLLEASSDATTGNIEKDGADTRRAESTKDTNGEDTNDEMKP